MRYRTLGASGLRVSELILGAMTFGEQGGVGAPLGECRRILDAYAEAGGNALDTAINYRGGASEEVLGERRGGGRVPFVPASKYLARRIAADANDGGSARKNLRAALKASLPRLRPVYLDIHCVNVWDRTPLID